MQRGPSQREINNRRLILQIRSAYKECEGEYGAIRITKHLQKKGILCGKNRVARLMRLEGIQGILTRKRYRGRKGKIQPAPNLLQRNFYVHHLNSVWISDITHIQASGGKVYIACTMDLFSKRIVGFSCHDHMRYSLIEEAIMKAIRLRSCPLSGLIHHSVKGSQYTSKAFKNFLQSYGIRRSFNDRGSCDNAPMESFFQKMKARIFGNKTSYSQSFVIQKLSEYLILDI